jgi:flagellin FlaB
MRLKMFKDERAFTGLEAAIVLIAFVTVAAVFSYVMLGAGFFATQKGQEVVHTGVSQASSSLELVGKMVAKGASGEMKNVTFTLQLAAGGSAIDMNKTTIFFVVPSTGSTMTLKYSTTTADTSNYKATWFFKVTDDSYLEEGERVQIEINTDTLNIGPDTEFLIEIKPPIGASYPINEETPPSIDSIMVLN